jgi:hypothetical protein
VQAVHKDLKANKGAVLVTGGGLALENQDVTKLAVQVSAMAIASSRRYTKQHIISVQLLAFDYAVVRVELVHHRCCIWVVCQVRHDAKRQSRIALHCK